MSPDFATHHLKGEARLLADAIVGFLPGDASGGGCQAFYSPEQWKKRGEAYGLGSVLILCHDGGDLAPFVNWDYEQPTKVEMFAKYLGSLGYFVEQCTSWYSAVYRI